MRDWKSVIRGIKAMNSKIEIFKRWSLRRIKITRKERKEYRQFWAEWWTPGWHEGRGPYVTIGLGYVAIYRGY